MLFGHHKTNWHCTISFMVIALLAGAWVAEPLVIGLAWPIRLGLATVCLVITGMLSRMDYTRRTRHERTARRYVDMLCHLNYHDFVTADQNGSLPKLESDNPWSPVFARIRDCMMEYGQSADRFEQLWTSSEVRIRRMTDELERLQQTVDGLCEPLLVTNQYDELVVANMEARELFGIRDLESPQRADEQVSSSDLVDLLAETRRRKSPSPRNAELAIEADGEPRWFRASARALFATSENETPSGVVVILADISSEKNIQRRHAEFVSAASHEMKTPLAGIRAYTELLRDGEAEDEETREEFLEVIDTQSARLQRLIENLLNLARIEAGVVSVEKQTRSLNELLEKVTSVVQPAAEQKEIELVKDLSPMYLSVVADTDMITQAAINLLSNAIKYTETGGRVVLRSRMEDNTAVFEVEDTGVGLSEEDSAKVFEKFYRVKKDKRMASGTGLGLPLAKHIVEDVHGGKLTVRSQLGTGSVFRASLPLSVRQSN